MKLATLADHTRDGLLVLVRSDGAVYVDAFDEAPSLLALLDDWPSAATELRQLAQRLELGAMPTYELEFDRLLAPLPRIHGWIDGQQGEPGELLGPRATIALPSGEPTLLRPDICIATGWSGANQGATFDSSARTLLLAACLERPGMAAPSPAPTGQFRRPHTAFAPFAVTTQGLGPALEDGLLRLPLSVSLDGEPVIEDAGDGDGTDVSGTFEAIVGARRLPAATLVSTGLFAGFDPIPVVPGSRVRVEVPGDPTVFGAIELDFIAL